MTTKALTIHPDPAVETVRKLKFNIRKFIIRVIQANLIAIATLAAASWAIPAAYAERGYNAVGGEWLLIFSTFFVAVWGVRKI